MHQARGMKHSLRAQQRTAAKFECDYSLRLNPAEWPAPTRGLDGNSFFR
jgi:hypothetical protein